MKALGPRLGDRLLTTLSVALELENPTFYPRYMSLCQLLSKHVGLFDGRRRYQPILQCRSGGKAEIRLLVTKV